MARDGKTTVTDQEFLLYQLQQFRTLTAQVSRAASTDGFENLADLAQHCEALASEPSRFHDDGPELLHRLMTAAPGLAVGVPRDLLWYLGAECLHFMPDAEIEGFSQLDEDRRAAAAAGQQFDWPSAVRSITTLQ